MATGRSLLGANMCSSAIYWRLLPGIYWTVLANCQVPMQWQLDRGLAMQHGSLCAGLRAGLPSLHTRKQPMLQWQQLRADSSGLPRCPCYILLPTWITQHVCKHRTAVRSLSQRPGLLLWHDMQVGFQHASGFLSGCWWLEGC